MTDRILAIDQGTTSTRAILFGPDLLPVAQSQQEFPQHFPQSGWVEHDPEDLWRTTVETCRKAASGATPAAIGITNQRETAVIWERDTGRPIHPAIVWQDRRTSGVCAQLKKEGCEAMVAERTGLLLDPYFSATKFPWMLDRVDGAREAAESGKLLAGTVDSWLLWRLTDGAVHATDATNASRTMLYNIHSGNWDSELCKLFRVPQGMLPEVRDSAAEFGAASPELLGSAVPIRGIAGDQQAAAIGQACFRPGMMKSTYGTGCFALLNTGSEPVSSANRLLTTVAYQLEGKTVYALEGSIFVAGAVVQWLRDGLGLIGDAAESGRLAAESGTGSGVVLVPAFVGLGAPYWDAECRGAVYGLTRATGPAELASAALQSVGYQTRDLVEAMRRDWSGAGDTVLRVDGGMTASDWTMQFLADILGAPVDRPAVLETTAVGAAWLAGMKTGICPGPEEFAESWALEQRFEPRMGEDERTALYASWQDAVRRTLTALD